MLSILSRDLVFFLNLDFLFVRPERIITGHFSRKRSWIGDGGIRTRGVVSQTVADAEIIRIRRRRRRYAFRRKRSAGCDRVRVFRRNRMHVLRRRRMSAVTSGFRLLRIDDDVQSAESGQSRHRGFARGQNWMRRLTIPSLDGPGGISVELKGEGGKLKKR